MTALLLIILGSGVFIACVTWLTIQAFKDDSNG